MLNKIIATLVASVMMISSAFAVDYSGKTVTMWIHLKLVEDLILGQEL